MERIVLPAHELLFRWLISQLCVQSYFVNLLWFLKVKFFQNETNPEHEKFLMTQLSKYYAVIITSLAARTYAGT